MHYSSKSILPAAKQIDTIPGCSRRLVSVIFLSRLLVDHLLKKLDLKK